MVLLGVKGAWGVEGTCGVEGITMVQGRRITVRRGDGVGTAWGRRGDGVGKGARYVFVRVPLSCFPICLSLSLSLSLTLYMYCAQYVNLPFSAVQPVRPVHPHRPLHRCCCYS